MKRVKGLVVSSVVGVLASFGQTPKKSDLDVRIVSRQNHETTYAFAVAGSTSSTSRTNLNCNGDSSNLNCSGTTNTTSSTTPPASISYQVRGATLSLQLPDGRIAVVNCDSKAPQVGIAVTVALLGGGAMRRRSCQMPMTNEIKAEFSGDTAKLKWPVSIDGKKIESETYKILGVIDNR